MNEVDYLIKATENGIEITHMEYMGTQLPQAVCEDFKLIVDTVVFYKEQMEIWRVAAIVGVLVAIGSVVYVLIR